jgi:glutamyl-tRNA reductase
MHALGMVGVTVKRQGQTQVARCTFKQEEAFQRVQDMHRVCGFVESLYLSTCNRVEVLYVGRPGVSVQEYRARVASFFMEDPHNASMFHAYADEGAVERLYVVACALDSVNPGDAQVLGQLKQAYVLAQEAGCMGPVLRKVCEEAFKTAKKVRACTALGAGRVSMASLATEAVQKACVQGAREVVLVGVGEMTRHWCEVLRAYPHVHKTFVNRTLERAQTCADLWGGRALSLEAFVHNPCVYDVLLTATSSAHVLFDALFFQKSPRVQGVLCVDLAVPRDIDADAARSLGARVYDIDALTALASSNRQAREQHVAQARVWVDEALSRFCEEQTHLAVAQHVVAFREHAQSWMAAETARLCEALGEQGVDPAYVKQWGEKVVRTWMHGPTLALKTLATEHGSDAAACFVKAWEQATHQKV